MAEDMQHMQQEAARRVHRMQEHSRRVFEEHQGRTPESLRAAQPPQYAPPPLYRRSAEAEKDCQDSPPLGKVIPPHCGGNVGEADKGGPPPAREGFQGIIARNTLLGGLDTEQILLLGLALLLFRNGCRVELVLALLYLAM